MSIDLCRLRLLLDVLSMWKNTTNFVRVQEYKSIDSKPIEVVARELASTTVNKSKYEASRSCNSTALASEVAILDNEKNETCNDENVKEEINGESSIMSKPSEEARAGIVNKRARATRRTKARNGGDGKKSRVCINTNI